MEEQNTTEQQGTTQQTEAPQAPVNVSPEDVEKNKAMAIIGYIIPILFFIPLVTEAKDSVYAKFHANQQLILLIASIGVSVIGSIIPILGWFIILPLGSIAIFVLAIIGLINAAKGQMKELPFIGSFKIIN